MDMIWALSQNVILKTKLHKAFKVLILSTVPDIQKSPFVVIISYSIFFLKLCGIIKIIVKLYMKYFSETEKAYLNREY